jgi:DNA-directed RNA polymerase specialized sigma24 family protein
VRQRFWQELEFDAMARLCGVSVAAIKARYYRALRRLQQLCALLERLEAK